MRLGSNVELGVGLGFGLGPGVGDASQLAATRIRAASPNETTFRLKISLARIVSGKGHHPSVSPCLRHGTAPAMTSAAGRGPRSADAERAPSWHNRSSQI